MTSLIISIIAGLTFFLLSGWFAILLVERVLYTIDGMRKIHKAAALDAVQIWTSRNMAKIDISRERDKLELSQEYHQMKLDHLRQFGQLRIVEQRRQLQTGNEATQ